MISRNYCNTKRLKQHYLCNYSENNPTKEVLLFIHGNGSSSTFWDSIIGDDLLKKYHCIAPDLRGYGLTEAMPIDATKSMQDVVLDLEELLKKLSISKVHLIAHSLGGAVAYQFASSFPTKIQTMSVINPCSPYGFGGTKGLEGISCSQDYAGSGGGIANANFVKRLAEKDYGSDDPQSSPRMVMKNFYWHNTFEPSKELENRLLDSLLSVQIGEKFYPGDFSVTENFPYVKPGVFGPINALSPKYMLPLVDDFIQRSGRAPILWIRGDQDKIVSDTSVFDIGFLGKAGFVPNYPGEKIYPPQPMVSQTRAVFEKRNQSQGASFEECVFEECGHSPFLEQKTAFMDVLINFIESHA